MLGRLLRTLLRPRAAPVPEHGLAPEDLDAALPEALAAHLRAALAAAATGRTREATRALDAARAAFPESPWPWILESRLAAGPEAEALALDRAAALDRETATDRSAAQHLYARGRLHLRGLRLAPARLCLDLAHRLRPQAPAPLVMLGLSGCLGGDLDAARGHYDRALSLAAPHERGRIRLNRMIDTLPQVFDSADHVALARAEFSRELDALLEDPPALDDPVDQVHRTVFYLCYQGENDRALNEKLARLFLRACPALGWRAPALRTGPGPGERPRVGFVSMFLTQHSVGAWYRLLVQRIIESGRFDCTLFTYDGGVDADLRRAAERHGRHVDLAPRLADARRQLADAGLDVLLYTDVGMHPFLYFLAFARLAPLQGLLVGHPCTSGIPALDVFISNAWQDADDAQAHYSERLVRLPSIPVFVAPPAPADTMPREALGWSPEAHVYLCPMLLQKLHPDFDWALAEILRRDPAAEVVLFADPLREAWEGALARRFARTMPDVAERISFRPFAPAREFQSLLLHADCVLDPFHFSGGATTYVALGLGVPVVTLPGPLFRSRMTAGICAQAGVTDCVARDREHFVSLALDLAASPATRSAIGARLRAAGARIFETDEGPRALMDWIESAARGA